jgi:hypothetical protein
MLSAECGMERLSLLGLPKGSLFTPLQDIVIVYHNLPFLQEGFCMTTAIKF